MEDSPYKGNPVAYVGDTIAMIVISFLITLIFTFILVGNLFLYTGAGSSTQKRGIAKTLVWFATALSVIAALFLVNLAPDTLTAIAAAVLYIILIWTTTAVSYDIIDDETINTFGETFWAVVPLWLPGLLAAIYRAMTHSK